MREELFIFKDFRAFKRQAALYYSLRKIEDRFQLLKGLSNERLKFLFPIKSFPHPKILALAAKHLSGFDISNKNERSLIPNSNEPSVLWSSSPFMEEELLKNNVLFQDINDGNQLQILMEPASALRTKPSLRLNTDFLSRDSRFGLRVDKVLDLLDKHPEIDALHTHIAGQENTKQDYVELLSLYKDIVNRYQRPFHLNFGGGFAPLGEEEFKEVVATCQRELQGHTLYFEPGRWITANAGFAAGKILSVEENRIVISLSPSCHLKWIDPTFKTMFQSAESTRGTSEMTLCGPTCFEGDVLGTVQVNKEAITPGMPILISPVSGYAHAWNHSFNGLAKADVVFIE